MVLAHLWALVTVDTGGPDEIAQTEFAHVVSGACRVDRRVQVVIQMVDALRQESVYVIQYGGALIALYSNVVLEPQSLQINLATV